MEGHSLYRRLGRELERLLILRTSPLAVRLVRDASEIPRDALRPRRDGGYHLSQCQAFALSRRGRRTVAMLKEDHWCWAPLIGLGLVEPEPALGLPETGEQVRMLPRLERGKYLGVVSAPLREAGFVPDVVIIYANPAQVRSLLLTVKYDEGAAIGNRLDPINSCVYAIVDVLETGEYRVLVPCAGEYARAAPEEHELIFALPPVKLERLLSGLSRAEESGGGYARFGFEMRPDFPRPDFYRRLFATWGLDVEPQPGR
ncbi:MAG: DUF169 domain-containing protein [Dehalococcoidales bacterium]|nr:DUF169 domain-containing protein [Dehalococcoidales bacterium]